MNNPTSVVAPSRWGVAALKWTGKWAVDHWPAIAVFVVSGGYAAYLASITAWLTPYGPIVWLVSGLAAILVLSCAAWIITVAMERRSIAAYNHKAASTHSTNTLATEHRDEVVRLADFYHPFFRPTENVRFENCDLLGPSYVAIQGCTLSHCGFIDCEVVIVRKDRPVKGAMLFRGCTFLRCRLYRVTLVVNVENYAAFPAEMKAGVPVISDGMAGDL